MTPPVDDDEMIAPGGLTWDEPTALPWLADLECPRCGQISGCDEDCA